ncbi:hypothetical protein DY000_02057143 [Brassica cretica]|uniref:Uncharacterized protein n=1 Tax=Brassica cretica TaxID=69181 RepID=A0ABQ7ADU4_BRACR|nr:hypothetical protein DY000_02057143 [Brassica cretica]
MAQSHVDSTGGLPDKTLRTQPSSIKEEVEEDNWIGPLCRETSKGTHFTKKCTWKSLKKDESLHNHRQLEKGNLRTINAKQFAVVTIRGLGSRRDSLINLLPARET